MGGNEMKEKIKIVLADDNKDFCQVLKEYLSNEDDIEILGIAKDGIEALELVKSKQPDLLVLDVIMPHLDGLGVIEKLNEMELEKMQAVLYTLADKFLTKTELNRIKEMIAMTKLGEMLVADGIEKGIEKGIVETCRELGVSFEETAEKIKQRFCISENEAMEIVRKYWL